MILPSAVKAGERAFANMPQLTSFTAPKLTSIGDSAFISDGKLSNVCLDSMTKTISSKTPCGGNSDINTTAK